VVVIAAVVMRARFGHRQRCIAVELPGMNSAHLDMRFWNQQPDESAGIKLHHSQATNGG
jgi:hypothetical protein